MFIGRNPGGKTNKQTKTCTTGLKSDGEIFTALISQPALVLFLRLRDTFEAMPESQNVQPNLVGSTL